MRDKISQMLHMRQDLAVEVKHFCDLLELDVGILARDAAIVYKMTGAAQDLSDDVAVFFVG